MSLCHGTLLNLVSPLPSSAQRPRPFLYSHSLWEEAGSCSHVSHLQTGSAWRWLAFNAVIIVTIVWIDNHAHYREMGGKGRKSEPLRRLVWVQGLFRGGLTDGVMGGNEEVQRDVCNRLGAWESLFVQRVFIWSGFLRVIIWAGASRENSD